MAARGMLGALALAVMLALAAVPARAAMEQGGHDAQAHGEMPMDQAAPTMDAAGHEGMDAAGHEGMDAAGHEGMADGEHAAMGGEGHDHAAMMAQAEAERLPVGVTEHLGQVLPADVVFKDSQGDDIRLGDLFTVPTIVLPVYYSCPNVCHILQSSFARILPKVNLEPGRDIQVVSISFDSKDTPGTAAQSKRNFAMAMRGAFPPEYWKFLSGDEAAITRTMNALGFGFQQMGDDFAHPVVVIAVAPGGKIVRYLYGTDPLPFDVTMAATEAAQGKVGLSVKRVLAYCFSYDPEGRRYTFDLMRVAGISILGFIAIVMVVLFMVPSKRKRRTEGRR